ncbi:hypothetical protein SO802_024820 [Lithocarpus litseifolius]|uniref:Uncharacterized protein n=1 Tax=Lithocarpus litseifolius TaxID=425828 RepID=A0AAW2CCU7_9ROSI
MSSSRTEQKQGAVLIFSAIYLICWWICTHLVWHPSNIKLPSLSFAIYAIPPLLFPSIGRRVCQSAGMSPVATFFGTGPTGTFCSCTLVARLHGIQLDLFV